MKNKKVGTVKGVLPYTAIGTNFNLHTDGIRWFNNVAYR